MNEFDIHLAAARIDEATIPLIEGLGFVEDLFRECENCTPTIYHATFRGDQSRLQGKTLWDEAVSILKADGLFNGLLEQEAKVSQSENGTVTHLLDEFDPLPIQACPPNEHKACDVHIGVRLDREAENALDCLYRFGIASFKKRRPDGEWRIFTATFDKLDAGRAFYDFSRTNIPRNASTTFKIKLEKIVRVLRQPRDAVTLPLTYEEQLITWLGQFNKTEERCGAGEYSSVRL